MPLNKEKMRDYMRERRKKEYAEKMDEAEDTRTDEPHPVYPQLKRYSDREYDENGLVMKVQKCEACGSTWGASLDIPCPYCDGSGNRKPTTRIA